LSPQSRMEYTIPPYVGAATVDAASKLCAKQGGRLATVVDGVQNDAMLEIMLKYKRDRATIGARLIEGNWTWSSAGEDGGVGEVAGKVTAKPGAWKYENWASGQPDAPKTDACAEMWTTGEWNDVPCTQGPRAYFCEVWVPPGDFTFPCSSSGVDRSDVFGESLMCRYDVTSLSDEGKRGIHWWVARDRCKAMGHGAHLAEPRSTEQSQFLASILRKHGAESLWIGLRKQGDGFVWDSDGSELEEKDSHWAATEPQYIEGSCVEMWEDGTWNDRSCDIGKVVACEVVAGPRLPVSPP